MNIDDVDVAAAHLMQLYPDMSVTGALHQATKQMNAENLAAATSWARFAEILSEREALLSGTAQIVA